MTEEQIAEFASLAFISACEMAVINNVQPPEMHDCEISESKSEDVWIVHDTKNGMKYMIRGLFLRGRAYSKTNGHIGK